MNWTLKIKWGYKNGIRLSISSTRVWVEIYKVYELITAVSNSMLYTFASFSAIEKELHSIQPVNPRRKKWTIIGPWSQYETLIPLEIKGL